MSNEILAALVASLIAMGSASLGYWFSAQQFEKDLAFKSKSILAEKKLQIYLDYMTAVNKSWAQYNISGTVDPELRQVGIDAFEALRILAPEDVTSKATELNEFFAQLYPPFEITDDTHSRFNEAFNALKIAANEQLIFSP